MDWAEGPSQVVHQNEIWERGETTSTRAPEDRVSSGLLQIRAPAESSLGRGGPRSRASVEGLSRAAAFAFCTV